MADCLVTGPVTDLEGNPVPSRDISFLRNGGIFGSAGAVRVPDRVVARTDSGGNISVTLAPGEYTATFQTNRGAMRVNVNVPSVAAAVFSTLIDQLVNLSPAEIALVQGYAEQAEDAKDTAVSSAVAAAASEAAAAISVEQAEDAKDTAVSSAEAAAASETAAAASEANAETFKDLAQGYANVAGEAAGFFNRQNVAAILADTDLTYTAGQNETVTAGDIIRTRAEGFSYEVAASGASDHHVTTAGGVKLYVLPDAGGYNVKAFGAIGDNTADDTAEIQAAMNAGMANGTRVQFPAGDYKITDTISLLNATSAKSFGFYGQNGNSTRVYFHNAVSLKNLFFVDTNVNYLEVSDLEFLDNTARTSRSFYFQDFRPDPDGDAPAWKHLFRNVRITRFKEGVRFDGGATTPADAHQSEVMFLHSKTRNCETGLIYNNTQAVNHQLIGFDMENDAEGVSDEWTHIKMERGTTINHIGGSVIGKGPYLSYTYSVAGGFQDTSQFASKGVRVEKRGGASPVIDHNTASTITVSNSLRVIIDDMPVSATGGATLFARFGGRSFAKFQNVHANVQMDVEAYITTNLAGNGEYGSIVLESCNTLNYKRISTVTAYGGAGVAATNYRSIPAEISRAAEGRIGQNDGAGYFTVNDPHQTIYQGGWITSHIKTLVLAPADSGGFGPGVNPATALVNLPLYGRPCKFRLLRDDINAGSAFQLNLIFVVAGVDYTVATITPTVNVGGHFEADIQTPTGLTTFFNDGVNWDGKMKVVKSGTVNGYVGLIMIDYM